MYSPLPSVSEDSQDSTDTIPVSEEMEATVESELLAESSRLMLEKRKKDEGIDFVVSQVMQGLVDKVSTVTHVPIHYSLRK